MEASTSKDSHNETHQFVPPLDLFGKDHNVLIETLTYIIASFGIPGNVLTIVVLTSTLNLRRKPINCFLIHQSVIDSLACIFTIIELILRSYDAAMKMILCKLFLSKTSSVVALYASTYNITALTVERYFAVTNPFNYDPNKVRGRLPFIFASIWCFAVFIQLLPLITTVIKYNHCLLAYTIHHTMWIDYFGYQAFIVSLVLPLIIMVFCYTRMFHSLIQSSKLASSSTTSSAQRNMLETCLIITLLFVMCWMTNELGLLLTLTRYYENLTNKYYTNGRLLILLNSCLNPYVYVVRYEDFKKQLKVLFYKVTKT